MSVTKSTSTQHVTAFLSSLNKSQRNALRLLLADVDDLIGHLGMKELHHHRRESGGFVQQAEKLAAAAMAKLGY